MGIHALVLARDESHNLSDCIHSLRLAVDEITVFDTGSRDRSSEVAHELGARWVPIAWHDDFALARNEALERIGADWILVIDADERLDPDAGQRIRAAAARAAPHDVAFHLEQRTYTDDLEALGYTGLPVAESMRRGASGYVPRPEPRLLRSGCGLHYVGSVGERLHRGSGAPLPLTGPTIGVLHHGRELEPLGRRAARRLLHLRLALRAVVESGEPESFARLGALLNQEGHWRAALAYLRAATAKSEEAAVHLQAGVARLHLGLVEGAVASFRRAHRELPDHPEVATCLARALIRTNHPVALVEAGELLETALDQAPQLDQAVLQRAVWQRRCGEFEAARACLQTLVERNPVHTSALKELGAVALLQGQALESEQHLRQALRMRPDDPEILNNLGCALERRGMWREALETFDRAVQLAAGDERYLRNRCVANAACGRLAAMCRDAHRALLASEDPVGLLLRLREDCLDADWVAALRRLENWAVENHWLSDEGRILPVAATASRLCG
ncbi:MAG: tetratricopeptide repeat protein [Candidatus Krumholzibacteriia bacterium]